MRRKSADRLSRRAFMGQAAAVAAFTIVPRHVLGGARHVAPSDKLNIAGIGIGGRGEGDLDECRSENIVALCDVDEAHAGQGLQEVSEREEVDGLPQDARRAEGHRRGHHRHAGPSARRRRDGSHQTRQARLLREAADALHLGGPATDSRGPRGQGRDPAGQSGPGLGRQSAGFRDHLGRRHRSGSRGACLVATGPSRRAGSSGRRTRRRYRRR